VFLTATLVTTVAAAVVDSSDVEVLATLAETLSVQAVVQVRSVAQTVAAVQLRLASLAVAVATAAEVLAVAVLQLLVVAAADELHVRASCVVCSRDEVAAVVLLAVLQLADQAVVAVRHVQLL
jgi:hypothetical protein